MKLVIIICSLLFLSFLLFRNSFPKFFEGVSILLFRLGFSILLLYGVHLLVGSMGYAIPVNLFTGAVAAMLGIPGIISVVAISILI
ncbi:MAG: pro-sigmaK processing inhibitor BofA family protein [Psychrobacillus psychrotolerans]